MNGDAARLDRLNDIIVPGPVPWWPPAPGGCLALGLAFVLILLVAGWALRRRLRRTYRREALAAIRGTAPSVVELATLLKRVALTAYPREQSAGLTGEAWRRWLAETGGRVVPPAVADTLAVRMYAGGQAGDITGLASFVQRWIRRHRFLKPETRSPEPPC